MNRESDTGARKSTLKRVSSKRYLSSVSTLAKRIYNTVPQPLCNVFLKIEDIYEGNLPKIQVIISHFEKEGRLDIHAANKIIRDAVKILTREANLIVLQPPVNIIGDTHGQFYDLLTILKIGGHPSRNRYVFLGDYVDRGCFSCEVILTLFSIKQNYPDTFWLLRGNHETRHMTSALTFKRECEIKYNSDFYDHCMKAFDCLPLCAIIQNEFLCMHGGISPGIKTLDDIKKINRFREPPFEGPMCDILWSDPFPDYESYFGEESYKYNDIRTCSVYYSIKAIREFLHNNDLRCIIRAHEYQSTGSKIYKSTDTNSNLVTLFTVFSCPHYMDLYNNKGAIIRYEDAKFNIKHFSAMEHPYWFPGLIDAFSFTMPFIFENVTKILVSILKTCIEGGDSTDSVAARDDLIQIRNTVRCFAKFAKFYTFLRISMQRKCGIGMTVRPIADEDSRLDLTQRDHTPNLRNLFVSRLSNIVRGAHPDNDMEPPVSSRKKSQ